MIVREEFYYQSTTKKVKIHALRWVPESKDIKGIIQISHGMMEFIDRYESFALWMAEHGYIVTGNDHAGHGSSIQKEEDFGYFYVEDKSKSLVRDIHKLRRITEKIYPDIPYYMLGHSMGSFVLRQYISIHGKGLYGAVIMGTAVQPEALLKAGTKFTQVLAKVKGWRYRSNLIHKLVYSSYNKKFEPGNTEADWLTKDESVVEKYVQDKRCSFKFTLNGHYNLFSGLLEVSDYRMIKQIPKTLPLLLVSGEEDPVGDFGKAVKKLSKIYKQAGIHNVEYKLYPGDRHEILNETDKLEVYRDIYRWIEQQP